MKRLFFSAVFVCVVLTSMTMLISCGPQVRPDGILDADTYVDYLTDVYIADGYFSVVTDYQYEQKSAEIVAVYDSILHKYGIVLDQVTKTNQYYLEHTAEFEEIHRRVIANIEEKSGKND